MKKIFRLGIFIFILSLGLSVPKLSAESILPFPDLEPNISMDFQDANLKDILKLFSIQSGLNFIASEAVQNRKVTLYLDQVPLNKAMDKLFKANNLSYELDKDANIFIVKDLGKPQVETVTEVFYLKHASVSSSTLRKEISNVLGGGAGAGGTTATDSGISIAVKKAISNLGSVIEDYRTNSLIVTDIPSRMPVVTQIIASLDVPTPQVMLEVEILDVNKDATDKIGLKFGQTPLTMVFTAAKLAGTPFPFSSSYTKDISASRTLTAGNVNFSTASYQVYLDFLRTQTDTKFLARPRLLTLNNETAEIKIVTQEAVGEKKSVSGEAATEVTTTEAERYETGVSLRVTPQINIEKGEITMFIVPMVAEATASGITSSSGVKFYNPEVRTTKSIVRIKDAETIILGGLIRNKKSQTITKLPILGDLPLLGGLFRHKDVDPNKERELLVFITPHIVKDTDIKLAKTKKVTLPVREQNTISGVNRELKINATLNSFEKKE